MSVLWDKLVVIISELQKLHTSVTVIGTGHFCITSFIFISVSIPDSETLIDSPSYVNDHLKNLLTRL